MKWNAKLDCDALKPDQQINRRRMSRRDRIIIGLALFTIFSLVLLIADPVSHAYRYMSNITNFRIRSIGLAAVNYAEAHDGKLPDADHWEQTLGVSDIATVPTFFWERPLRFAMNRQYAGKNIETLTDQSRRVIFFESTLQNANAVSDLDTMLPCDFRNGCGGFVSFADGHQDIIICNNLNAFIQRDAKK